MKKKIQIVVMGIFVLLAFAACKSTHPVQPPVAATQYAAVDNWGVEKADALSKDGTAMVTRSYVFWEGTGVADDKQLAIEEAQREAYAAISRTVTGAVQYAVGSDGNLRDNVQQKLTQHWTQFANVVLRGCSPFGKASVTYDNSSKMYSAKAKVAMEEDKYKELLGAAANQKDKSLNKSDLENFNAINQKVMGAIFPK